MIISEFIQQSFGIKYKLCSISKLLKRIGIKRLKPKLIPGKPQPVAVQRRFVSNYFMIKDFQNKDPGIVQLFIDGMHLVHQVIPSFYWGIAGKPMVFNSNSSRNRLNILGAYDVQRQRLIHLTSEKNCDAERVIEFLDLIHANHKDKKSIILHVDNAPYFRAAIVNEWLDKHPEIILNFLPSYSPNLNLIERLWRFVKKHLVKNRYFQKYKTFRANVFRLLNNLDQYSEELQSLITENFEIIRQN